MYCNNHLFWFSWAAFRPETRVYGAEQETAVVSSAETPSVPSELPGDFEIAVYQGEDVLGGPSVQFSEVLAQGKPVILNLWAGLCPICRAEMPHLQEAYNTYGDRLLLVGVDVGPFVGLGTKEDALALLNELGIMYPAGTTSDASVMRDYQVLGTPTTLFVKPSGEITQRWVGLLDEDQLIGFVEQLLEASSSS